MSDRDDIKVVLTTNAANDVRIGLAYATIARWCEYDGIRLTVLDAASEWPGHETEGDLLDLVLLNSMSARRRRVDHAGSLRTRHMYARRAGHKGLREWYVHTDDDILPPRDGGWLKRALDLIRFHDDRDNPWGMVFMSLDPFAGSHADGPVREVQNGGGLRLVRKGAIPDVFPARDDHAGYDHILTQAVRDNGYRVGVLSMPEYRFLHLGDGTSTIWDELPNQPRQQK